jgi:hypothetical protein
VETRACDLVVGAGALRTLNPGRRRKACANETRGQRFAEIIRRLLENKMDSLKTALPL